MYLLDKSVDDGRYPKLARPTSRFRQAHPESRFWLVGAIEQPLADGGPVVLETLARLLHRTSVDAGASLIGLHAFPRSDQVLSGQHLPKQVAVPLARLCISRRRCFTTSTAVTGFTGFSPYRLQLPGLLVHCIFDRHDSPPSFSFGPSVSRPTYYDLC
jgi:hypothetical protein